MFRRYTPAQRKAILKAAEQHPPAVVRRMAREGKLDGVTAFDPGAYIYTLIKQQWEAKAVYKRCPTCGHFVEDR